MSAPSYISFVVKRPWLLNMMKPLSKWYANAAGYRQLGLRADDLIPEENNVIQTALKRLPPQEAYDRVFRLRRAMQLSMTHQLLPKEEWTKPEDDLPYLTTIVMNVEAEIAEREDLEAMVLKKRKTAAASDN
ncbi:ubiquinol-cytochrome C reductase complex 14kD subunit-domain-containing protein [Phaeosphaeriaceae sp. PMI808]|nr:ubiquinol-cytochrome C reductase complex 14kD subunit-domain-containing protein [Phaeosphaeriaceae sp. PMI808]